MIAAESIFWTSLDDVTRKIFLPPGLPGAAACGAVEALTDDLCAAAWEEFQRIEAEGGVLNSLQQGYIQNRVQTPSGRWIMQTQRVCD